MTGAITTKLDPSVFALLAARRRAWIRDPEARLARLRRLRERHASGYLGTVTESTTEQSWNEQFFAKVLGYQTLLSHDRLPFHLRPKTYNTDGHYNDFSLGNFGSSDDQVVLASAELKGTGADLDAPQKGASYKGRSAVEQALETARAIPTCRWVLVSNFEELRLYLMADHQLVATAALIECRAASDLFGLCALFDRRALLGDDGEEGEMAMATNLDPDHPMMPIPHEADCYRIVFRFTPAQEMRRRFFVVENHLRGVTRAVADGGHPEWLRDPNSDLEAEPKAELRDGWVGIDSVSDSRAMRIAASNRGEVQVSVRLLFHAGRHVEPDLIGNYLRFGCDVVTRGQLVGGGKRGRLEADLRDVKDAKLVVDGSKRLLTATKLGAAPREHIPSGTCPFDNADSESVKHRVSELLCELAIQFRGNTGGVAFDPDHLKGSL